MSTQIRELRGYVQTYAWGKRGSESLVAKLSGIKFEEDKPYAELWFGTHPSGPTMCLPDQIVPVEQKLMDVVKEPLPFLLKVLSVGQALSIQAHPDKELAKKLHATRPDLYKDDNHKPEMTVALTNFELLCGFRTPTGILECVEKEVPELGQIFGEKVIADLKLARDTNNNVDNAVRAAFHSLMHSPREIVAALVDKLVTRLRGKQCLVGTEDLALILAKDYPGDPGIFCAFLMNRINLLPGQAGPNIPHAYLKGDCVECMACSDNVVRAGLTPKPVVERHVILNISHSKDTDTLCAMLTYSPLAQFSLIPAHREVHGCIEAHFEPNGITEFVVISVQVPPNSTYEVAPVLPAMVLVTDCDIMVFTSLGLPTSVKAHPGTVLFLPKSQRLRISTQNATKPAVVFVVSSRP